VQTIPSAAPASPIHPRRLGEGFTFGGRPPSAPSNGALAGGPAQRAQRRGHHHKHSLSHNFFSFLEPGAQAEGHRNGAPEELVTNPTPVPVSPWNPITPFTPDQSGMGKDGGGTFASMQGEVSLNDDEDGKHALKHAFQRAPAPRVAMRTARFSWTSTPVLASLGQFILGAWVWAAGQGAGSLALTGLGYWVVFDSFGVVVGNVLPAYLERERRRAESRGRIAGTMYGSVMSSARRDALNSFRF
jgi:hypothetical protein